MCARGSGKAYRRAAGPLKKSYRGDAEAAETAKKSKKIIVQYCILCGLSASAVRFLILSHDRAGRGVSAALRCDSHKFQALKAYLGRTL
jgi:hypothetical protein